MNRLWLYGLLPLLHFVLVVCAAFATHYSNGINVRNFHGNYSFWMDLSNLGYNTFQFTRWMVPLALLFVLWKGQKKTGIILFSITATITLFFSEPLCTNLILFWERDWDHP